MSLQKGLLDYAEIVRLSHSRFHFRFVGSFARDGRRVAETLRDTVEIVPRVPQWRLPDQYGWGDLFIFPTLQDGFAVVLAQAQANGLPILATTNCAGPDMIIEGKTGWILPIRSPQAFLQRLIWCDENRELLAAMAEQTANSFSLRDWSRVAEDFETLCAEVISQGTEVR